MFDSLSVRYTTMLAVCVILCLVAGSDAVTKSCTFDCMRSVIGCKRKALQYGLAMDGCCQDYYDCYFGCKPDATELPPCGDSAGKRAGFLALKRGSWSKRGYGDALPLPQDFPPF